MQMTVFFAHSKHAHCKKNYLEEETRILWVYYGQNMNVAWAIVCDIVGIHFSCNLCINYICA